MPTTVTNPNPYTNAYCYPDSDSNTDSYSDCNANSDTYCYSVGL